MHSLQGQLLIASPHLADPNFSRSVVLIVQHEPTGSLGLVLNRPSGQRLVDVWGELTGTESDNLERIYVGGPIEGPLMAIHTRAEMGEVEIVPGLWFATHRDYINAVVNNEHQPFRLFNGYSGWGEGQLDDEMKVGGWLTLEATAEFVFAADDDALWQLVTRRVGSDILRADPQIREWPDDPSLN